MTYDEFAQAIAVQFDLNPVPQADNTLIEDLGLDSLDCFNLILLVEELADVGPNPPDLPYPLIASMGDAYRYCTEMVAARQAEATP